MAKIDFNKLRTHNLEVSAGGVGKENEVDVIDTMLEELPTFSKQLVETRRGELVDEKTGVKNKPKDISLARAVEVHFGITEPKVDPSAPNRGQLEAQRDRRIVNRFLANLDIHVQDQTMFDIGRTFGIDNMNVKMVEDMMLDHGKFNNPMNTGNIASNYHFIIPELITNAIRIGYQGAAMHGNWIAGTQNVSQIKLTMPQIKRGDAMPVEINEGADIPMGSLLFGQKEVGVYKVGVGFNLTDELILGSSIDMLVTFLGQYGVDMSIGSDVRAMNVLVNGEQADNSESAPVVGVQATADGLTTLDIDRVNTRMARLGMPVSRMVGAEGDVYHDLNSKNTNRELLKIPGYSGRPMDVSTVPANQILYISVPNAMVKLAYRSMLTERRRNPRNQTEELFVSDWLGFAIVRRDARVLQTKATAFASADFPAYMDIDARLAEDFKSF